jgi:hypothetical protein
MFLLIPHLLLQALKSTEVPEEAEDREVTVAAVGQSPLSLL